MEFCQFHKAYVPFQTDYPVDVRSNVPQHMRASNMNTSIPPPPANGGLYNAPQAVGGHASIPVVPTATNMTYYNLRSANPPPGAVHQFAGTNRLGNNYLAMPGVFWLNDQKKDMDNKFNMKVLH